MNSSNFYLSRFGFCPPQIQAAISSDVKIIVVIPCHDEENLNRTLESFQIKSNSSFSAEVIVVINASSQSPKLLKERNEKTLADAKSILPNIENERLKFHFIFDNNLPEKHAGVGLARKIGMDEAVFRFHQIGFDGVIVCADADAKYEPDFLEKVHTHFFIEYPSTTGCSIYFEHPLSGNEFSAEIYQGILLYELHLRYYKNALEWCGFPFAFHTIGSSMVVRSSAYQKTGGMNKRKAGEDFYFLQKIIGLGNFSEMNSTCVIPSPRPSHRVPFGTGKAVGDWLNTNQKKWNTYSISIFDELKNFHFQILNSPSNELCNSLKIHSLLRDFLEKNNFTGMWNEIQLNTASRKQFLKRLYSKMDAFMILKAVHFLRDAGFGTMHVENTSAELLKRMNINSGTNPDDLIITFRNLDQKKIPQKVRD